MFLGLDFRLRALHRKIHLKVLSGLPPFVRYDYGLPEAGVFVEAVPLLSLFNMQ